LACRDIARELNIKNIFRNKFITYYYHQSEYTLAKNLFYKTINQILTVQIRLDCQVRISIAL